MPDEDLNEPQADAPEATAEAIELTEAASDTPADTDTEAETGSGDEAAE